MGIGVGVIFGTLVVAAQIYFLCGGNDCDSNDKEGGNSGCLLAVILGFISMMIYVCINS